MLITSVKSSHFCLFKCFFCNAKVQLIKDCFLEWNVQYWVNIWSLFLKRSNIISAESVFLLLFFCPVYQLSGFMSRSCEMGQIPAAVRRLHLSCHNNRKRPADTISEVGLVPGGVVHVLQDPPDDPLQLLPRPLLLLQRLAHSLVVLLWKNMFNNHDGRCCIFSWKPLWAF